MEGKHLPHSRQSLKYTGDMIGTFMAWLTDVGAGGGTSYTIPGKWRQSFPKVHSFEEDSCANFVSFKIVVLSIQIKTKMNRL